MLIKLRGVRVLDLILRLEKGRDTRRFISSAAGLLTYFCMLLKAQSIAPGSTRGIAKLMKVKTDLSMLKVKMCNRVELRRNCCVQMH
jgi:hypothetical protein